jgi:hypothetical protein
MPNNGFGFFELLEKSYEVKDENQKKKRVCFKPSTILGVIRTDNRIANNILKSINKTRITTIKEKSFRL